MVLIAGVEKEKILEEGERSQVRKLDRYETLPPPVFENSTLHGPWLASAGVMEHGVPGIGEADV